MSVVFRTPRSSLAPNLRISRSKNLQNQQLAHVTPSDHRTYSLTPLTRNPQQTQLDAHSKFNEIYSKDKVLGILKTNPKQLLSPQSTLISVVIGYTNQQLELLNDNLLKNAEERDDGAIQTAVTYLKSLGHKLKKNQKLESLIRTQIDYKLLKLLNTFQSNTIGDTFKYELEKLTNTLKKDNDHERFSEKVVELIDFYSTLANYSNIQWRLEIRGATLVRTVQAIIKSSKELEFFKKLIETDSILVSHRATAQIGAKLRNGTKIQQHLYQFEEMFETNDEITKTTLQKKFVHLYSFGMIKNITTKHINANDQRAKIYMELLALKAANLTESNSLSAKELTDIKLELFEVAIYMSTRMGNYNNTLNILDQMKQNGIQITPKAFHSVLTSLRQKKFYDAVLMLLRNVPSEFLKDQQFKQCLITDFLVLLRQKFGDNPVMVLSHYITIFNNLEVLLNELGLMKLMMPLKDVGKIDSLDPTSLVKAELPKSLLLGDVYPSIRNMTDLYTFLLNFMSNQNSLRKLKLYKQLFRLFIEHAKAIQQHETAQPVLKNHPFSSRNLDDAILNIFLKRVLSDFKKPATAMKMLEVYMSLNLKKFNPSFLTYMFSLHHDDQSVQRMVQLMEEHQIKPDFFYITGQIFKCYDAQEVELAKKWYNVLCAWKFPIRSGRLIRFIDKVGWNFPETFDKKLLDVVLNGNDSNSNGLELYEAEEEVHDDEFLMKLKEKLVL